MIFEKDWLARQIERTLHAIAALVFQEELLDYSPSGNQDADLIHERLLALLSEGRVNEAEDLLFDSAAPEDKNRLRLAVDFYHRLNGWSEEMLETAGFSREEVRSGLTDILEASGFAPEIFQWDAAAPADE